MVSEGTASARRILGQQTSLADDPQGLGAPGAPTSIDHKTPGSQDMASCCTHDCAQGSACHRRHQPKAHTEPPVPDSERNPAMRRRVWLGYVATLAASAVGAWEWLRR